MSRQRLAWALRALAAVALVVALALSFGGDDAGEPTLLLLDRSASVTADPAAVAREQAWVRAAIEEGRCGRPCRVVAFAGGAAFRGVSDADLAARGARAAPAAAAPDAAGAAPGASAPTDPAPGASAPTDPAPGASAPTDPDPTATDLAAAIRLAAAALPGGGRAVVLSDGFATDGDATAAASAARRAGVRVDGVALAASPSPASRRDAAVTRLAVPSPLRAGDALTIQATVRSTHAGEATVALTRDGADAGRRTVALRAGDNPLLLADDAPAEGWHAYRLTVALPGDAVPADDALDATTRVAPPARALVVEQQAGAAGALPAQLEQAGIPATTIAPDALDAGALAQADVVVLADLPARALASAQQEALASAVRDDGLGLLVLGGPHSLSLGGWAGTPLDALLPVASLRPGGVRRRRAALQLVLDRSSSMNDLAGGDQPKIAMARAAARSALRLTARDENELGIVAFDAVARDLVPLQRTTAANAGAIADLIGRLDADGGTNVLRGLERGVAQLERSEAPVKHLIVLSDGVSEPGDDAPILRRLRRARITLTTVALGQDADAALMRRLATAAGGRFHAVPDARRLPRLFARETRRSAPSVAARGRLGVRETAASPLLASLDAGGTPPPLAGVVLTRVRPDALAPLSTTVNGTTAPVLAHGQAGLGRVAVWTPGAGAWSGRWPSAAPRLLPDAVRWSARAVATPPLQPALRDGRLVVDPLATSGEPLELATVSATVRTPDGTTRGLTLPQVAPSRYAAPLPSDPAAPATGSTPPADATPATGSTPASGEPPTADAPPAPGVYAVGVGDGTRSADALLAVPYAAELRPRPADASQLGEIAAAGGGRLLDPGDPHGALAPPAGAPAWRWLVAAAIALLLAAVALPRLPGRLPRRHHLR